jgi:HEAT repeat protein
MKPPADSRQGRRAPEPKASAVDALARSVGGALGRVARLVHSPRRAPRGARPTVTAGAAARARGDSPTPSAALARLEPLRARLTSEVARLEQETTRLHKMLASSAALRTGQGRQGARSLEGLLERSRAVRERLYETRQELVRIERHIARERLLLSRTADQPTPRAAVRPPPRRPGQRSDALRAKRAAPGRTAMAKALQRLGSCDRTQRLAVAKLAEDLMDDDPDLRRSAALRLGTFGSPAATELLLAAVQDPSERVCLAALNTLASLRDTSAVQAFRHFLHHDSSALRLAALRGLAHTDSRALTVEDLTIALEDVDSSVRQAAATLLGWRQDDAPALAGRVGALAFALRDADPGVRVAAAEALGSLGERQAVLSLMRAVGDEHQAVRQAALSALRTLVGEQVESTGAELEPEARVAVLKRWWQRARVDQSLLWTGPVAQPPTSAATTRAPARVAQRMSRPLAQPAPQREPAAQRVGAAAAEAAAARPHPVHEALATAQPAAAAPAAREQTAMEAALREGFPDLVEDSADALGAELSASVRAPSAVERDEPSAAPAAADEAELPEAGDEGFVDLFGDAEQSPAEPGSGVDHDRPAAAEPTSAPERQDGSKANSEDEAAGSAEGEGFVDIFGSGGDDSPEGDEPAEGGQEEYESIFSDGNK